MNRLGGIGYVIGCGTAVREDATADCSTSYVIGCMQLRSGSVKFTVRSVKFYGPAGGLRNGSAGLQFGIRTAAALRNPGSDRDVGVTETSVADSRSGSA